MECNVFQLSFRTNQHAESTRRIDLLWRLGRFVILLAFSAVAVLQAAVYSVDTRSDVYYDLAPFLASGDAANLGLPPYSAEVFGSWLRQHRIWGTTPNVNVPAWLPLFQLLATLDPVKARLSWLLVTVVCYAATLVVVLRKRTTTPYKVAWALAVVSFWSTLVLGQVYAPLALLAIFAQESLAKIPSEAAFLLGSSAHLNRRF